MPDKQQTLDGVLGQENPSANLHRYAMPPLTTTAKCYAVLLKMTLKNSSSTELFLISQIPALCRRWTAHAEILHPPDGCESSPREYSMPKIIRPPGKTHALKLNVPVKGNNMPDLKMENFDLTKCLWLHFAKGKCKLVCLVWRISGRTL